VNPYVTSDPDLRLDVDGAVLAPDSAQDGIYRFTVGPSAARVRLVSRSAVPADQNPSGDRRRLGVPLLGLALRGANLELFLPHDDDSLVEGVHAAEAGHLWTDGAAVLPAAWLRPLQGGFTLEVRLGPSALRYIVIE
jgi:hypothetical protein